MLLLTGWERDTLMWLQSSSKLNLQFEMDIPLPRQVCVVGINCSLRRYVHVVMHGHDKQKTEMIQFLLAINSVNLHHCSTNHLE